MARKTGVTGSTVKHLFLDAGVVYLNYDDPNKRKILGACRGGNTFTIETEWRDMPFDGAGGLIEGARRAISVTCSLTVNLVEISKDLLRIAVPGAEYGASIPATGEGGQVITGENYFEVKRKMEETIPDFEYTDVAIVAEYAHHKAPVVCGLKNAMANSNLELSFADADESVMAITFTGAFDPDNLAEEPWFIRIPEKETT